MSMDIQHCDPPSLHYPLGGETVFSRSMTIKWFSPGLKGKEPDSDFLYEVFFTDNYDVEKDVDWVQIASVPSNQTSFTWYIPPTVVSSKCRIAVRCRNFRGASTDSTISTANFSIARRSIASPSIITPVSGNTYQQFVPVVFDNSHIINTQSQRSLYQIYYWSPALDLDWILAKDNVPISTDIIHIDIRDWTPSDDYAFKFILVDEQGNSSDPAIIRDIHISPLNYFILDTKPPLGRVSIQTDNEFTNDRNTLVTLSAFDAATDIKSVTLQQREGDSITSSTEHDMSNIKTWYFKGDDGIKFLEALFKDVAGNTVDTDDNSEFFRTLFSSKNQPVTALLVRDQDGSDEFWTAFGGENPFLQQNREVVDSLDGEVSSMVFFDDTVYLGLIRDDNKGSLYFVDGSSVDSVFDFSDDDSCIKDMAVLKDKLYLGLQNGDLHVFDGSSMSFISNRGNAIGSLESDGINLYLFINNQQDVEVHDGESFYTASFVNVSQ